MSDAAEPVLELRDVSVEYPGGIRAIDGIHLRVFPHDLLGLLGPNGAGKSTLLAVVLGLQKPTRGTVRLFGAAVSPEGLRRLGYVPQRPQSTYPDFPATVLETVLLGRAAQARPFRGVTRRERREAEEILTLLDIHDLRDLGITIVLTSHEVHSVTNLANRIAFLSGTLLFDGDPVAFERHPAHIDLEDFPEAVMPKP